MSMDLYCRRCGEPWDTWGVHHGDMTQEEKSRFLKGADCPHCHGKTVGPKPYRAVVMSAVMDLMGDDLDGAACAMEDAEAMGMFNSE